MSTVKRSGDQRIVEGLPDPGGIDIEFGAYLTPADDDYRNAFTKGLVVFDTNALLNLYRYTPSARADFVKTMSAISNAIWIPRRVVEEFWTNREGVIADSQSTGQSLVKALEEKIEKACEDIRGWARRISLPQDRAAKIEDEIKLMLKSVSGQIVQLGEENDLQDARDTNRDPVLIALKPILQSKVGGPFNASELEAITKEAERRNKELVPPGYRDKGKDDGNSVGDYFIWEQVIREAERRKVDVLIVTNDTKDDWWRKSKGQVRGPRPELYEELRSRARVRLFLMRPETFLRHAQKLLSIAVAEDSVTNVEFIDNQTSLINEIGITVGGTEGIETILGLKDLLDKTGSRTRLTKTLSGVILDFYSTDKATYEVVFIDNHDNSAASRLRKFTTFELNAVVFALGKAPTGKSHHLLVNSNAMVAWVDRHGKWVGSKTFYDKILRSSGYSM